MTMGPHIVQNDDGKIRGESRNLIYFHAFFFSHSLLVVDPGYMVESLNWGISPAKAGACETKLVGGLEHDFIFPYIGNSHPN